MVLMPPPAVIILVIWPEVAIPAEIAVIRAVSVTVSSGRISGPLVKALSVHPAVKSPAMIEHAVQYYPYAQFMSTANHTCQKLVAQSQVLRVCHALNILSRVGVLEPLKVKRFTAVVFNNAQMRVHMPVVLRVVLMGGRRYEE